MSRDPKQLSRSRRWIRIGVWVALAVVLTVRVLLPPERPKRFEPRSQPFGQFRQFRRPPTPVYPPAAEVPADLWRIHIEIALADVEKLRGYSWHGWRGARQERPEVLATVREGGVVYTNVALHLKGAAGSFRPFDDKPALTLNFSKRVSTQRFHGYSKISLNNSVQDPSYLCEAISRELFEAAGVPVPRAGHATVLINHRDLGMYVLTEGFGKQFLKRYFKNVSGNLYDGGFLQEINANLDVNSGDNPDDRSDLRRLFEAATDPNLTNRWPRLSQVLDVDRFISFIAMEVMTCHWDGYTGNKNNYRLFHDLETDRMVFMPHGLDQMFGWARASTTDRIEPERMRIQGLVAQAVLATSEGRRRYFDRIATLRTKVFLEDKLTSRVRELSSKIQPTLAAYDPQLARTHDRYVEDLCERITERARSISEQLAARQPISFDAQGVARISGWTRGVMFQRPGPGFRFGRGFESREEKDGSAMLHVVANDNLLSSWRARVILGPGRYHLEGRARTSDVGDAGGVCLRISGVQANPLKASDDAWASLRFDFMVRNPGTEVELICELRAAQGEAWFDQESLRLVRE